MSSFVDDPMASMTPDQIQQLMAEGALSPVVGQQLMQRFSTAAPPPVVQQPPTVQPTAAVPQAQRPARQPGFVGRLAQVGGVQGDIGTMREAGRAESEAIRTQGAIKAAEAHERGELMGQTFAEAKKFQDTEESLQFARQTAAFELDKKQRAVAEETNLMEQYPGVSVEDARRHKEVVANKDGTYAPEQVNAASAALKQAQEVDPERVWGGDEGRKFFSVIGMALGAFGSALTKTPNYAMEIVQNMIERDIASQKEAFHAKRQNAKDMRAGAASDYERVAKHYDTELERNAAAEQLLWIRAAKAIEQMAVKYKTPESLAAAQQLSAMALGKAAEATAKLRLDAQQAATERLKVEAAGQPKQHAIPVDIEPIGPVDEESVKKARGLIAGYGAAKGAAADVKKFREKWAGDFTDQAAIKDAQAMARAWTTARKQMEEFGAALTENEERLIGLVEDNDPTNVGFVLDQINAAERALDMTTKAKLRAFNFRLRPRESEEDDASSIGAVAY